MFELGYDLIPKIEYRCEDYQTTECELRSDSRSGLEAGIKLDIKVKHNITILLLMDWLVYRQFPCPIIAIDHSYLLRTCLHVVLLYVVTYSID